MTTIPRPPVDADTPTHRRVWCLRVHRSCLAGSSPTRQSVPAVHRLVLGCGDRASSRPACAGAFVSRGPRPPAQPGRRQSAWHRLARAEQSALAIPIPQCSRLVGHERRRTPSASVGRSSTAPFRRRCGRLAAVAIAISGELDGRGPLGIAAEPVLLCLPRRLRIRRGPSVRPFRSELEDAEITEVDGIRVTSPCRTAFDIARLGSLTEGVIAIDYLARGRPEFLGLLADYALGRRRLQGAGKVLTAVSLATPRSRSAGEHSCG